MNRNSGRIFKALSDPSRIRIVKLLEVRALCVCEVREVLALSNSTVSKHLSILRDADLILDEKDGKWVNYRLNGTSERVVVRSQLALLKDAFEDDAQVIADRKKVRSLDRMTICGM